MQIANLKISIVMVASQQALVISIIAMCAKSENAEWKEESRIVLIAMTILAKGLRSSLR